MRGRERQGHVGWPLRQGISQLPLPLFRSFVRFFVSHSRAHQHTRTAVHTFSSRFFRIALITWCRRIFMFYFPSKLKCFVLFCRWRVNRDAEGAAGTSSSIDGHRLLMEDVWTTPPSRWLVRRQSRHNRHHHYHHVFLALVTIGEFTCSSLPAKLMGIFFFQKKKKKKKKNLPPPPPPPPPIF